MTPSLRSPSSTVPVDGAPRRDLSGAGASHLGQSAGTPARRHRLRGADAVDLASALALGVPELTVAVWDRRLHASAGATGLGVPPAALI